MGKQRFPLQPLLDYRASIEQASRAEVAEHARACAAAHDAWRQAVERLGIIARDREALERLKERGRLAWSARERRREEP